jgi:hypothetical protein
MRYSHLVPLRLQVVEIQPLDARHMQYMVQHKHNHIQQQQQEHPIACCPSQGGCRARKQGSRAARAATAAIKATAAQSAAKVPEQGVSARSASQVLAIAATTEGKLRPLQCAIKCQDGAHRQATDRETPPNI